MIRNPAEFITGVPQVLGNFQTTMMEEARRYRHEKTVDDITSLDALRRYFSEQTGFVRAKWSGNPASEDMLKESAPQSVAFLMSRAGPLADASPLEQVRRWKRYSLRHIEGAAQRDATNVHAPRHSEVRGVLD
jgi:hypothetical protein